MILVTKMKSRLLIFTFIFFCLTMRLHYGCSANMVKRVVGGENTDIKSVPYALSLMWNGKHVCGANIINQHWCITAAHCITLGENPLHNISVRSGSSILNKGGIVHNITEIITHEYYSIDTNDYDIAVMKVTPPFARNNSSKAIKLAQGNPKNIVTSWGTVCGWGYFMMINSIIKPVLSKHLRCMIVPIIPTKVCNEDYEYQDMLTHRMVCYGLQNGGNDACKGDSGGALVNKDDVLLGITSWGAGCAEPGSPGVYTDAILLRHWIKNTTKMET